MKPRAVLFGRMDIPAALEDEFNYWYDTEHLPSRVDHVPGFLFGRRFRALDGAPKYAALYELESAEVLQSAAYLKVREDDETHPSELYRRIHPRWENFARTVYEEITPDARPYSPPVQARVLLVAMLVPRPEHEDEFNDWYNTEHLPALRSVSGFLSARRFRAVQGVPKYAALYDVASYDVLSGPEYLAKRTSPWASRIRTLLASYGRSVYERIYPPVT